MKFIDINAMRKGNREALSKAYPFMFSAAKSAAQRKLPDALASEAEDVATVAVCQVLKKILKYPTIKTSDDLMSFTVSTAYHEACNRLRRHLAQKRGCGNVESTNALEDDGFEMADENSVGKNINILERAKLLTFLKKKLEPKDRSILDDWFMSSMSYSQIAQKHKIASGSVGVYISRALSVMKKLIQSVPELERDMKDLARITMWLTILP